MSEAEVGAVLESVRGSSPAWRGVPIRHRAELMHAAAAVLRRRVEELAGLITAEMGKASPRPVPRSRSAPPPSTTSQTMPRRT